ncbi:transposable element Tcb1 transposase [Trichonephila clavipes]|nr:transposable element Tcb1 transposase [Trichonephila clavipes]
MHECTTDRRGRSHRPQYITTRKDRQIVRMTVTDSSITLRTIVQHIESVTNHSVTARTIRRGLKQNGLSARRPLLGLPLTQNHRHLHQQWCDEIRMLAVEWYEVVCVSLLASHASVCNTMMVGFESRDSVER